MRIERGKVISAEKLFEELSEKFSGNFEVRVFRVSGVNTCARGSACLVRGKVEVSRIYVEDGVLVIECTG